MRLKMIGRKRNSKKPQQIGVGDVLDSAIAAENDQSQNSSPVRFARVNRYFRKTPPLKRNLITVAIIFAAFGAAVFLYNSFAYSPTQFNELACTDPSTPGHKFVHSGTCTPADKADSDVPVSLFPWCADVNGPLTPPKDNWINDGNCPPAGTPAGSVSISVSASPNIIYQDNPVSYVSWNVAGAIDHCVEVMAPNSPNIDPQWKATIGAYSPGQKVNPTVVGLYIYGIKCLDAAGNKINNVSPSSSTTVELKNGSSSSSGSSSTTYNLLACINPSNDNHLFKHSGACTDSEISTLGLLSSNPFTWCASSTNSAAWIQDGNCPGIQTPPLTGPDFDQPGDNILGDENPDSPSGGCGFNSTPSFNKIVLAAACGAAEKRTIHAIYVVPSDYIKNNLNRKFNDPKSHAIQDSLNTINSWLKKQTGGKVLRVDKNKTTGNIIVSYAVIGLSAYKQKDVDEPTNFNNIRNQLILKNYNKPNKVYAVFYEGFSGKSLGGGHVCGASVTPSLNDLSAQAQYAITYLREYQTGQGADKDCPGTDAASVHPDQTAVMAHELMHSLAQVPAASKSIVSNSDDCQPNGTTRWLAPQSGLQHHVADSKDIPNVPRAYPDSYYDILYFIRDSRGSPTLSQLVLDYNHQNYFKIPKTSPFYGCPDFNTSPYLATK